MPTLRERIEERSNLVSQMREYHEKHDRTWAPENDTAWDEMNRAFDAATSSITREQALQSRAGDTEAATELPPAARETESGTAEERAAAAQRAAFRTFLRDGSTALTPDQLRDLSAVSPAAGGFLVAPEQFVTSLIQAVDDLVYVRQWATKYTMTQSESLGVPSLDTDISDADWTSEVATGTLDTAMSFGKRQLTPHPLAKRVKLSQKLMRQASIDPEALVQQRLAYKFGITQEKGFLLGSGSQQPLGVFTADSNGISTARDVTCGSTTAPTADGLIDMKFGLKAAYWDRPSTRWMWHRDAVKLIRKLKDSNNNYVWAPALGPGLALAGGLVDTIVDVPYVISEYVPNTFTTGLYVGILGDFSFYWIVDALDMQVQRLVELYAETNQVGFIGRLETDGMPVLEEAFVRGKLG